MEGEYEKRDMAKKKGEWGAVEEQDEDGIGHCCFSSFYVEEPKKGGFYIKIYILNFFLAIIDPAI